MISEKFEETFKLIKDDVTKENRRVTRGGVWGGGGWWSPLPNFGN